MIEDWTLNYKPDLLTFVPYEWSFNIILRDFEMVWIGNQHNWIECTSNKQENGGLILVSFRCRFFFLKWSLSFHTRSQVPFSRTAKVFFFSRVFHKDT